MDNTAYDKLRGVPLFKQLPEAVLLKLSNITREEKFERGDVLFEEGDPGDAMFIVVDGRALIQKILNREEQTYKDLGVAEAGQIFGEMALFDDMPRSATVRATSPLIVLRIGRAEFDAFLREDTRSATIILGGIIDILSSRLRETAQQTATLYETGNTIASIHEDKEMARRIMERLLTAIFHADAGAFCLWNPYMDECDILFERNLAPGLESILNVSKTGPMAGFLKYNRTPFVMRSLEDDHPLRRVFRLNESDSLLVGPLIHREDMLGYIVLAGRGAEPDSEFTNFHKILLSAVCSQVLTALVNLSYAKDAEARGRLETARGLQAPGTAVTTQSQKYKVLRCLGRGRVAALYEVSEGSKKLLLQDILLKPSAADENETAPEEIFWEALDDANRTEGVSEPKPTGQHSRDWFAREIARVASWQVPAMPTIIAAGATDERAIVVLEHGEADRFESLMERVERDGPLSEETARSVAAQVIEATAVLHARKPSQILGEIRPSNLTLDTDGKVRFLTYGDARFIETPRRKLVTRTASAYTSPERRDSGSESTVSDVWCIGALLCFLMGGHIDEPLTAGSDALRRVVKRCLEAKPGRRYLALHDLREALAGREPPEPDERPPVLVVEDTDFNGGAVLPGTVVQGSFRVRNEGGGLMTVLADPKADWIKVNPDEWSSNDETVQFWCTTDTLVTNNAHSSVIRVAVGNQVKFVNVRVRVLKRPEMSSAAKGGWLLRLVVPIGVVLVAGFTYGVTHGWAALFKLFGFK